ncbi:MAG: ABC transporter permease [Clostridia bacterium]|nr:ABC transporter permease [Clostridia bacterium]
MISSEIERKRDQQGDSEKTSEGVAELRRAKVFHCQRCGARLQPIAAESFLETGPRTAQSSYPKNQRHALHKRTSWQIQKAVVNALFLREMKTRFGSKKMGYFWAIVEPAAYILILWALFGAHMRGGNKGVEYPIFLMTGLVPFNYFSHISGSFENAFSSNQTLFNYKQVKPLDTLFARILVESLISSLVFVFLLIIGAQLGYPAYPHNILMLTMTFIGLSAFSFGFGLNIAVISQFSETFSRIMGLIRRPLFFMSGIFFSVDSLPGQIRNILLVNPLLHFMELIRVSFFSTFTSPHVSPSYILSWTIGLNLLGFWLYSRLERRIIAS